MLAVVPHGMIGNIIKSPPITMHLLLNGKLECMMSFMCGQKLQHIVLGPCDLLLKLSYTWLSLANFKFRLPKLIDVSL